MTTHDPLSLPKQCPLEGCDWRPEFDPQVRDAVVRSISKAVGGEAQANNAMDHGAAVAHYVQAHTLGDWILEVARLRAENRRLAAGSMFGVW